MGDSSTAINTTIVPTDSSTPKISVKPFNGNRNLYHAFKDSIKLYLLVDEKLNTEEKKIAFVLSLLNEGEARIWRTNFLKAKHANGALNLGTYAAFMNDLDNTFKRDNEEDEALFNVHRMKQQKDESANQAVTRFCEQASLAGIDLTTNPLIHAEGASPRLAIDYLKSVLNEGLVNKVTLDINEPTDNIENWVKIALRYDKVYHQNNLLQNFRKKGPLPSRNTFIPRYPCKERNPDTMNIDRMTIEEHDNLMKKGACFFCKKPRHCTRECPNKRTNQSNQNQKRSSHDTARYI
ncbi:hypothetical protein DFP72DRAFT_1084666 [Ephemerocybe angulata]|uniref:CCHC-type domain-containing protein n=1 Tax=Ephemerocybe angulata TaxID=980116 RepID=A0A8H6H666_9AGAR|nr:hypothetical protein DFP72DRAFT_1084666 [Tulosesus angulatus]